MNIQYAILSGCFGAIGGAFGKLCGFPDIQVIVWLGMCICNCKKVYNVFRPA